MSGSTMTVALNFRRVGSGECLFSVLVHDYALSFVFVRNEYFKDSFQTGVLSVENALPKLLFSSDLYKCP